MVDSATLRDAAAPAQNPPAPAVPMSRRAAREALRAQAAASLDLTPMAASAGRRIVEGEQPEAPVAAEAVEQLLAETLVVVSASAEHEETAAVEQEPAPADESPTDGVSDPFVAASAVFRERTTEPVVTVTAEKTERAEAVHVAPRKRSGRKMLAAAATVGVMGLAGLLAISVTLPAEALAAARTDLPAAATSLVAAGDAAPVVEDDEIQAFVSPSGVENDSLGREEGYDSISMADLAAEQGIRYSNALYTNDPNAAIQWPFVVGVGMSSGYGMRWGRLHAGIDLTPGAGAPIQVIADGVVRKATESGGAYGVTVYVDHIIDGKLITSHYSHMQYGSLRVQAGDHVKVGDIVGLTGNTGRSYGAHLHFEIIVNGSTIDPLPWMRENAGRYDGVSPVS